jgi:hypothetical protein
MKGFAYKFSEKHGEALKKKFGPLAGKPGAVKIGDKLYTPDKNGIINVPHVHPHLAAHGYIYLGPTGEMVDLGGDKEDESKEDEQNDQEGENEGKGKGKGKGKK